VALAEEGVPRSNKKHRMAFVFSRKMEYPPDVHDMKAYYVSKEMINKGFEVNWVQLGGSEKNWKRDGIRFCVLRAPRRRPLPEAIRLLRLAVFCLVRRIEFVYEDEWLFLRDRPVARMLGQMVLRGIGVKVVLDQRDPYVDWEVATGKLKEGTNEYRRLTLLRSLLLRQTDLIILPSEAYSALYVSEGIPEKKVFGTFRGIDAELFKPQARPNATRLGLGLDGSFVIGWFGIMHSYRMIREVLVPLIENLGRELPNAHVLIGGEGPLLSEFEKLQRSEARSSFTMLGNIPYTKLPDFVAACDVTICPISTRYRFSTRSNWLKIAESVAVGTPDVATRTEISGRDLRDMKGVYWVDPDYRSFLRALREVQENLGFWQAEAEDQARHFEGYSIEKTVPKIVERVVDVIYPSRGN
jgi:glycosyltransferase involved in cell wall biosynthesis